MYGTDVGYGATQLLIEIDEAITAELLKLDPVANMGGSSP